MTSEAFYVTETQAMAHAVFNSPGDTLPELRHAIETYVTTLSGGATENSPILPPALEKLIRKIALHAYKVTAEDIAELQHAGYSEDAIFEITVSAALSAGVARLSRALNTLQGDF